MDREPKTTLLVVARAESERWRRALERVDGTLYHSRELAETQRSEYRHPLYFEWLDREGRDVAIAVGIATRSPLPYLGRFSQRLNFESYPAVFSKDPNALRPLVQDIAEFAKRGRYRTLELQSFGAPQPVPGLDQLEFLVRHRTEFVIDLTLPEEELWRQLAEHHRRKIKKARQHALSVQESSEPEAIWQLKQMQSGTREHKSQRGEALPQPDDGQYRELADQYLRTRLGTVHVMRHAGETVSAALIAQFAGRAFYIHGGSSEHGYELSAPALLLWNAMLRCREAGCREFNLGGVPASAAEAGSVQHGLYRFKSGFGGRSVACVSGTFENRAFRAALWSIARQGRNAWNRWSTQHADASGALSRLPRNGAKTGRKPGGPA